LHKSVVRNGVTRRRKIQVVIAAPCLPEVQKPPVDGRIRDVVNLYRERGGDVVICQRGCGRDALGDNDGGYEEEKRGEELHFAGMREEIEEGRDTLYLSSVEGPRPPV
jgi:hypothetical protein